MKHKKSKTKTTSRTLHQKIRKSRSKNQTVPGEGRYYGDAPNTDFNGRIVSYNRDHYQEKSLDSLTALPKMNAGHYHWLQIKGLTAELPIEKICQMLSLHPLSIEDIFNTYHPAKFEEFPDYLLLITKFFVFNSIENRLEVHHLALILKDNILVTFQDSQLDVFDHLLTRLKTEGTRVRNNPTDYLFYRLLDIVLDQNFLTIDSIWDKADLLDEDILQGPDKKLAIDIQIMKREMILFIKSLRPVRQSVTAIIQSNTPRFSAETRLFFRDLQDHILEITELAETLYAYLIESYNLYLSVLGQKTNETMKVLTAIATIFIPLTFIVGVYGMNFHNMPELSMPFAYPLLWGIMISITLIMFFYFKRKEWF